MSEISERDRGNVDDIMDNFDFARVRKAMEATHWAGAKVPPEEWELRTRARQLLVTCLKDDLDCTATGGFRVVRDTPDTLWLGFVVADWDAEAEGTRDV